MRTRAPYLGRDDAPPGLEQVASGKVRDVYALDDEHLLFVTTDRISAFDVVMDEGVPGKGRMLNRIAAFWFERTRSLVSNHMVTCDLEAFAGSGAGGALVGLDAAWRERLSGRSMVVRRAQPTPVEWVVRGYLAGSGWKEYRERGTVCGIPLPTGLEQAAPLPAPLLTPTTKHEAHDRPLTPQEAAELVGPSVYAEAERTALALFELGREHLARHGVILADTKFEFGHVDGALTLIDEALTPDSSRFWPAESWRVGTSPKSYDKQILRDWLETLDWDKNPPPPALDPDVLARVAEGYRHICEEITGRRALDAGGEGMSIAVETLRWEGELPGHVSMIEQTLLPEREVQLEVRDVRAMVDAIYRLAVRGAPAIGVAAAYGVVLGVQRHVSRGADVSEVLADARAACDTLATSRPTAVNLFWALDRMRRHAEREAESAKDGAALVRTLHAEALAIHREDAEQCRRMGAHGAELIEDGWTLLTHCNAGALATGGIGTALAPIYHAKESGKRVAVFADETRPLLQGARLTAWELMQAGIDVTLITDNMAARVMGEGKIDAVIVGSDRIARNGDVCNKIGTYGVALLARAHDVPFFVVAPLTTFDRELMRGDLIPIEERAPEEVTEGFGRRTAPVGVKVYSPAFDVTPARLVTAIVTEVGVIHRPDEERVREALIRGGVELGPSAA